jgi:alanyl-tRNA synthetase
MDFQEKKNLYKVRQTLIEMITDRGYNVPESEMISFEEFVVKYSNRNLDIYINDEFKNKKIYVYFHNDLKNFSKADLKNIMQKVSNQYEDEDINLILILKDKENSAISKELTEKKSFNAGTIIRELAKEVQGGGGGQAFLATAGGQNPDGIKAALQLALTYL